MILGSIPGMAKLIYLLKTSRPALRLYLISTWSARCQAAGVCSWPFTFTQQRS